MSIPLTPDQLDRVAGVLLGQAVGDALGVPYEFASPPVGQPQMIGGGLGDYAPGEYSDDTQMAVIIAGVLSVGADPLSRRAQDLIADGFIRWAAEGPAGIGVQTSLVLRSAQPGPKSAERLTAAARSLVTMGAPCGGNGSLMRTSVVALSGLHDRERTAKAAWAISELTHADLDACEACVLWTEAVRVAVLDGEFAIEAGLDLLEPHRADLWSQRLYEASQGTHDRSVTNGWCVRALQDAWSAIYRTSMPGAVDADGVSTPSDHLREGLYAAVRGGGDTDTVAAIAGGLLGARWGANAVPSHWREQVHGLGRMHAEDLVQLASFVAVAGALRDSREGAPEAWQSIGGAQ